MPTKLPARPWVDHLTMGFLIGATAWLSLTLAKGPGELAAIWIGNGIFTGWLLSKPTSAWPAYIVTGLLANSAAQLLAGGSGLSALLISLCDLIEVLTVAGAVRYKVPDVGDPKHWVSLGGVATASTLVACALSGSLASTVTWFIYDSPFWANFIGWYAAHVVGMVIIATTTLAIHRQGFRALAPSGKRLSFAISMLLIAAVGVAVFLADYPLLFMTYPPLLLGAFRHRFLGVAGGVILLATIGSALTSAGHGPLWLLQDIGTAGRIALLQLYIAGGCLMTIPVVLAMAERDRLNTRMRESERRYRLLADYSGDLIVRLKADGERVYVSPSSIDTLGWQPSEMLGQRWDLVHPADRARQRAAMTEVLTLGEPQTLRYRVRHKDGHHIWMEVIMSPIPSEQQIGEMDLILAGRDISHRVAAEEALEASRRELERLSQVDALTGVANRRQLEQRLPLALARLERSGRPVALMYLDIDHFKRINDTYGHAAGDRVIQTFAQRLTSNVRTTDLVVRLGGDEFVILMEDVTRIQAAEAIAAKILEAMREPVEIGVARLTVTTSIGVAFAAGNVVAEDLMVGADDALYAAKEGGRNGYRVIEAGKGSLTVGAT
ncbi:diguanylate cyclase [Pseudoxanthomonas sp. UTMC 1351]|uniref:diguanylate cyclase domain-containing protein n=1 Tax=Pseudoxanthomonas sp. UTMC 1351 TaxID=2695853 RepID=UPI0034CFC807